MNILMQVLGLDTDAKGAPPTHGDLVSADATFETLDQSIFTVDDISVEGEENQLIDLTDSLDEPASEVLLEDSAIIGRLHAKPRVDGFVQWEIQSEKPVQPSSPQQTQILKVESRPGIIPSEAAELVPAKDVKLTYVAVTTNDSVIPLRPKDNAPLAAKQGAKNLLVESVQIKTVSEPIIPSGSKEFKDAPKQLAYPATQPLQINEGDAALFARGELRQPQAKPVQFVLSEPTKTPSLVNELQNRDLFPAPQTPQITERNAQVPLEQRAMFEQRSRMPLKEENLASLDLPEKSGKKHDAQRFAAEKPNETPIRASFPEHVKEASPPSVIETSTPLQKNGRPEAQTAEKQKENSVAGSRQQLALPPQPVQSPTQLRFLNRERASSLPTPELATPTPHQITNNPVVLSVSTPYAAAPLAWVSPDRAEIFASSVDPTSLFVQSSDPETEARRAETPKIEIHAKPVAQQLAHAAKAAVGGTVEVRLSPEELGRVRLSLSTGEANVTVQIFAERPETLDLLRRNIDLLAEGLRQEGFTDLEFSFGDTANDDSGDKGEGHEERVMELADQTNTSKQSRNRADPTSGRLDLRL